MPWRRYMEDSYTAWTAISRPNVIVRGLVALVLSARTVQLPCIQHACPLFSVGGYCVVCTVDARAHDTLA